MSFARDQRGGSEHTVSHAGETVGRNKVMALINRPVLRGAGGIGNIDIAISPQQITIGSLLAHVARGDVVKVHSLRRGAAEAIEAVAHGEEDKSKSGRQARIDEIHCRAEQTIAAIVRATGSSSRITTR